MPTSRLSLLPALPLCILLSAGCGGPESAIWLEQFGFEWEYFNHRLSYMEAGLSETEAQVAMIGGTSTTGQTPTYDDTCDADTCDEFPFLDFSDVTLGWAKVETKAARFGVASVELLAGAEGVEETVEISLARSAKGEAGVILQGLVLDTDAPLAGEEACYDPAFGWHVKRLAVWMNDAELTESGDAIRVVIGAAFEAGVSMEEERVCIDEVVDRAQVAITVQVLGFATGEEIQEVPIEYAAEYAYGSQGSPEEQDDPDPATRALDLGLEDPLVGFSALDYRFHEQEGLGRGAYLRSFSFGVAPQDDWASAHATNYSPGTQLSGFDYAFSGRLTAVDLGDAVERGTVSETLEATLDEDDNPVITILSL